jgi:hypothetical protein
MNRGGDFFYIYGFPMAGATAEIYSHLDLYL